MQEGEKDVYEVVEKDNAEKPENGDSFETQEKAAINNISENADSLESVTQSVDFEPSQKSEHFLEEIDTTNKRFKDVLVGKIVEIASAVDIQLGEEEIATYQAMSFDDLRAEIDGLTDGLQNKEDYLNAIYGFVDEEGVLHEGEIQKLAQQISTEQQTIEEVFSEMAVRNPTMKERLIKLRNTMLVVATGNIAYGIVEGINTSSFADFINGLIVADHRGGFGGVGGEGFSRKEGSNEIPISFQNVFELLKFKDIQDETQKRQKWVLLLKMVEVQLPSSVGGNGGENIESYQRMAEEASTEDERIMYEMKSIFVKLKQAGQADASIALRKGIEETEARNQGEKREVTVDTRFYIDNSFMSDFATLANSDKVLQDIFKTNK